MKKLTVIGISGYTQGVRQVAKPTPKAIKKKAKIDCSSFLGSVAVTVSLFVETESVETTTGAETSSFAVSITVAVVTATVLAMLGIVFSSC
jgi:hypothetical protein